MENAEEIRKIRSELKERLRKFLEIHNKTRLLEAEDGTLKMHIMHAKTRNDKIKDKFINFLLLRLSERMLSGNGAFSAKDAVICEFLMEEIEKYVAASLNK